VVAAAGFGLVDAHPLAIGQVEDLVGQGELADLRMVERLGLPAPLPYVVQLPEQSELWAAVEQFRERSGLLASQPGCPPDTGTPRQPDIARPQPRPAPPEEIA